MAVILFTGCDQIEPFEQDDVPKPLITVKDKFIEGGDFYIEVENRNLNTAMNLKIYNQLKINHSYYVDYWSSSLTIHKVYEEK